MKKGFTLIELLVVISIISILTIITVSQFTTAKKKANDVARKGDLNALSKALLMYYADYGYFPDASNSGGNLGKIVVTDNSKNVLKDWGKEFSDNSATPYVYMKTLPEEKILATTYPFCYVVDATKTKFALFAMLENTGDPQCILNNGVGAYNHCGHNYCFSFVSPNAAVSDFTGVTP
jgi:prepilin-type N-terminal cleavage/methylation domain-containing protein